MNRSPRFATAHALAAALACAGSPPAQAAVSPSAVVSGSGFDVEDFSVALNPAGERSAIALAGGRGTRVQLLTRLGQGRSLQPSRRLEDLRGRNGTGGFVRISDPRTAVATDGTAIAAWIVTTVARRDGQPSYRLRVSTAPAGKGFGRPRTLRSSTSSQLELTGVVAGRRGLAVLSWLRGNRVEVAVRHGSRFAAPQLIGSSRDYVAPPQLALSPGGVAIVAWSPTRGSAAMAAVLRATSRRFGRARSVSGAGEPTAYARAVAGPGGAGVAWTVPAPPSNSSAGFVRYARLTGAGASATPVTLAAVDTDGGPHVSIPRLGVATAWRDIAIHSEPGDSDSITSSRLAVTASWLGGANGSRRLSAPPSLAFRPVLAALGDRALVAWMEAPENDLGTPVRLAVATAGGWQPTVTLPLAEAVTGPPTRRFGIDDDERRKANALSIAAGSRVALLGWVTTTQATDGERRSRLRVAAYRP